MNTPVKIAVFLVAILVVAGLNQTVTAGDGPTTARAATPRPDLGVHGEGFTLECARCHTPEDWRTLRARPDFDHDETGFSLRGAHSRAGCADCHTEPVFSRIGVSCADCHEDIIHRGELGYDCSRCHDETEWRSSTQRILEHQQTRFPLLGRHATLDCLACHETITENEHAGLSDDCLSCHVEDYAAASRPNHSQFGLSVECQECHSGADLWWGDAVFAHAGNFPLMLGHDVGDCTLCHDDSGMTAAADDCYGCHVVDYAATSEPVHVGSGFPIDCRSCHNIAEFRDVRLYGHAASGFLMFGEHGTLACSECHDDGVWSGRNRSCDACHEFPIETVRRMR